MSIALSLHETNFFSFQIIRASFRIFLLRHINISDLIRLPWMNIQVTVNFSERNAQGIDKKSKKKIRTYSSVSKHFRRWVTTAFPREDPDRRKGTPVPLERSACTCAPRGSARPCSPGQGRPQFPHLRQHLLGRRSCNSDSCRPAAPSDRTAAISVAISLPPRRIRAFRYPVRQQEQRDRRLMRYLRGYVYSPSPPTCPHAARCTHSRRVSLPSTSIEPARIEYIHQEHTSNVHACMRVCPHVARGRAKRRRKRISNGV